MRGDILNVLDANEIAKRWCVAFDKPLADHVGVGTEILSACRGFPTRIVVAAFEDLQHAHTGTRAPRFAHLRTRCQERERSSLERQHGSSPRAQYERWYAHDIGGPPCPICHRPAIWNPCLMPDCNVLVHDRAGLPTYGLGEVDAKRIRDAAKPPALLAEPGPVFAPGDAWEPEPAGMAT